MNLGESWSLITAIIISDAASNFIPGPNLLLVISRSLGGLRSGFAVVLGLTLANLVLFISSVFLVGHASQLNPLLSLILKIIFSGYLVYLGIRSLCACVREPNSYANQGKNELPDPNSNNFSRSLREGLVTCIINPTPPAYFLSLATLLSEKGVGAILQTIVIFGICCSVVICYRSCALMCAWSPLLHRLRRIERYLSAFVGTLFIFFGVTLVLAIK